MSDNNGFVIHEPNKFSKFIKDELDIPFKIAIHGLENSFSSLVTRKALESIGLSLGYDAIPVYSKSARNTVNEVMNRKISLGVVASINNNVGFVDETRQAFLDNGGTMLCITCCTLEIEQCLIAHQSIVDINQVLAIKAHPMALRQCLEKLSHKYPHIKLLDSSNEDDTAKCALDIASGIVPSTTATLASEEVIQGDARIKCIKKRMETRHPNITTFPIFMSSPLP